MERGGRAPRLRCSGVVASEQGFAAGDGGVADGNVISVIKFGGCFLAQRERRGG